MGMIEDLDPACGLCGTKYSEHGMRKHEFVKKGEDPGAAIKQPSKKDKDKPPEPKILVAPMPDLVLRQILLRKGLITSQDLEEVDRELTLGIQPEGKANGFYADPSTQGGDSSNR